jgi:polyisoprenoid-binding protein YceI
MSSVRGHNLLFLICKDCFRRYKRIRRKKSARFFRILGGNDPAPAGRVTGRRPICLQKRKTEIMKFIQMLVCAIPIAVMFGCGNPADNVPKAAISSDTNAGESVPQARDAADRVFAINPKDSKIEFIGSKVTGSHKGGFTNFTGELRVADGKLAGAGNRIVIDMNSTWSDNSRLTGHLKSADFFNVEKFPKAEFVSTAVEKKSTNYMVSGNLTLHGVTKQISFPADIQVSDQSVDLNAQFVLNRFDFEIKYPGKANDLIRKEVVLQLKVKATPGKPTLAALTP